MDLGTYIRRVQSGFGDFNGIVISEEEIVDWLNEAQATVIRETQCIKAIVSAAANTFPINIVDMYLLDRATYAGRPLEFVTQEYLDLWHTTTPTGEPSYYYVEGTQIYLWPTPVVSDTKLVAVTYVPEATQLTNLSPGNTVLQVPLPYHQDLVLFGVARAHEKNQNYKGMELKMEEFKTNVSMRRWEIQNGSDESSYIQVDPYDTLEGIDYGSMV